MSETHEKQSKSAPVAVLMGSDSDWDTVKETVETLKRFGVECEVQRDFGAPDARSALPRSPARRPAAASR